MRIITEDQYRLARKRVEDLLPLVDDSTPLDDPKAIELMMMSDIVIDYESEHFPIAKPSVAELIADGLKENHVTQKQLAEEQGISTTRVNDFVSGKSEPNLKTAGHICRFLKIRPAAMLMLWSALGCSDDFRQKIWKCYNVIIYLQYNLTLWVGRKRIMLPLRT